jgi:hypothetical protein
VNITFVLGTLIVLFYQLHVYAAPFESLAVRWGEERFDLLQPDSPGVHSILNYLGAEQIKDLSTQELQLVGASSGSRSATGSLNFMKSGVGATDGAKEAET